MKGIYAVTPCNVEINTLIDKVKRLLDSGVLFFQYRDKNLHKNEISENSYKLLELIKKYDAKLIINDNPMVAVEIGADGFHLGLEDYQDKKVQNFLKEHREVLNEDYIKGISCKWNIELIETPPEEIINWDYIAVGAFYDSKTKVNAVTKKNIEWNLPLKLSLKPIVAIGGINHRNFEEVISHGYELLAISEGIFSEDNSSKIINYFK